jgi:tetratricopeptide (TPR) repeat protein
LFTVPLLLRPPPLLTTLAVPDPAQAQIKELRPAHEAGFFGRRRELWNIERWLAGETRRISITGFGGQGKTELALEAARWLLRTGPFRRAVLVDYAQIQSNDALGVAVSTIAADLGQSLTDAEAAARVLADEPTLLILDNLETVPRAGLVALLDAAAAWSDQGPTRLLLTSRIPDFDHPAYRIENTRIHRRIALEGLGSAAYPDDALDWFAALFRLPSADLGQEVSPPKREELIALFDRVAFHPLSIAVLAQQLRTLTVKQLGERLTALLDDAALSGITREGTPPSLIASLRLSLDRLSEDQRKAVGRLGAFQGGAMEPSLLAITGLTALHWPALRHQLETAALIKAECIPGVAPPFLRFHPTLAPLLWAGLDAEERARLALAHRQHYHQLAGYLHDSDTQDPDLARAIALCELPNLLYAVDQALEAGDKHAMQFVHHVYMFLRFFGRTRDAEDLTHRAEKAGGEVGSEAWALAQYDRGEQLLHSGQAGKAAECFHDLLKNLSETPSHQLADTFGALGRCHLVGGRPDLAEAQYRRGLQVTEALEQSDHVKQCRSALLTGLGAVLCDLGRFPEARESYERALETARETDDLRGVGIIEGQLGDLALRGDDIAGAMSHYQVTLTPFQHLQEPTTEAAYQHQLGLTFQKAGEWDQAERHYRESAALAEKHGDLAGAAKSWHQLGKVCVASDRPKAAEDWYRRAIEGMQNPPSLDRGAMSMTQLAKLLQAQPDRLTEARRLAEESLAIRKTMDPCVAEIWTTYSILAQIADRQSQPEEAAEYRRQAREARRRFAGTAHEVKHFAPMIAMVVAAVAGHPEAKAEANQFVREFTEAGGEPAEFAHAIQRILAGERDPEVVCQRLSADAPLVDAILQALRPRHP